MNRTGENPRRHLWLLISLLLIFVISPFVAPYYYGPTILNIIAAIVLISATYGKPAAKFFYLRAFSVDLFHRDDVLAGRRAKPLVGYYF